MLSVADWLLSTPRSTPLGRIGTLGTVLLTSLTEVGLLMALKLKLRRRSTACAASQLWLAAKLWHGMLQSEHFLTNVGFVVASPGVAQG